MKILFLLGILLTSNSFSATCTSTSRNNYVTNQVLTSSALNADFNQLVTKANAFDGGCISDGTIEDDALNTSDFAPMLKGIKEGCKVSYSSATQISIGRCLASVNGQFVTTSVATTAAFGCTSCSSEVASTYYYAYIQTGSSGSTLTPLILTTAPNEDGYDNSGNKVLAKFYNNASSDIDQYSFKQWHTNEFVAPVPAWSSYTPTFSNMGTVTNINCRHRQVFQNREIECTFTTGTVVAAEARVTLPAGDVAASDYATLTSARGYASGASTASVAIPLIEASSQYLTFSSGDPANNNLSKTNGSFFGNSRTWTFYASVRVVGRD